jgi:hypothetical protein
MLMNSKMKDLVAATIQAPALSPELAEILSSGFVESEGCILFAAEAKKAIRNPSMDATEFESFANHVHMKSFPMSLLFASELLTALREIFPEKFVVIVAFDGSTATVRFHKDRPGTPWIDINGLDNFKEEAVGILYSI